VSRIHKAIGTIAAALAISATAAEATPKDPLEYPLKVYGLVLGTALAGGIVSWSAKVKAGTVPPWSLSELIGELCTSAFSGLLCFWFCQWAGLSMILTAPLAGVAGHMGTRAIRFFEAEAERRWGKLIDKGQP
jgi:hypothetical protein